MPGIVDRLAAAEAAAMLGHDPPLFHAETTKA